MSTDTIQTNETIQGKFRYAGAGMLITGPGTIELRHDSLVLEGYLARRRNFVQILKSMVILSVIVLGASVLVAFLKESFGVSNIVIYGVIGGLAGVTMPLVTRGETKPAGDARMRVEVPYADVQKVDRIGLGSFVSITFLHCGKRTSVDFVPTGDALEFVQQLNNRSKA